MFSNCKQNYVTSQQFSLSIGFKKPRPILLLYYKLLFSFSFVVSILFLNYPTWAINSAINNHFRIYITDIHKKRGHCFIMFKNFSKDLFFFLWLLQKFLLGLPKAKQIIKALIDIETRSVNGLNSLQS